MLFVGIMCLGVIYVDECPLDITQSWSKTLNVQQVAPTQNDLTFDLPLQVLRNVMRDFQSSRFVHDNVDFDVVLLSSMVCSALPAVRRLQHSR